MMKIDFKRVLNRYRALQALLLLSITATASFSAQAGGVVICNNCASPTNSAISSGIGLTVIVDINQVKLSAYNVEYDKELRRWRAIKTPVPQGVDSAFVRAVDLITAARAQNPNGAFARASGVTATASTGGIPIYMHPDNPSNSNGMIFPDAFKGSSAYDIVQNATLRQTFGQRLADAFKGTDSSSPLWNSLAGSVSQAVLSWGDSFGFGTVTIYVTWRDGTVTVYKLTSENANEAKYINGESRDAQGNKIPDASITDPQTAASYVGSYYFGELPGGNRALNEWLDAARMYGIPITGAGGNSVTCTWDGQTLRCQTH